MTTKRQIVKRVAEKTALTQAQTSEVVQLTLEAIMDAILAERRIELRNFGVFEVKHRRARKARNPLTGETLDVPPRQVVTFRPSRQLDERVAGLPPAAGSESLDESGPASVEESEESTSDSGG